MGLLAPDAGSVELDGGVGPSDLATRRRMGLAPQALGLYEELSGEANLRFFARMYGLSGSRLAERVGAMLELVGLTERRRDRVSTYSSGMKRRLNLAAALVHQPELLLLDEPTVGVDPQSRNAILDRIRGLAEAGSTVVYCTHYMEEAQRLCERVAILDRGRLLALDTVENLIAAHGGTSVVHAVFADKELRVDTKDPLAELRRLESQGDLIRFSVERPDLESVFLAFTGRPLRD
jgi:ABC-2 type transport system ATP-binding protein